MKNQKSRFAVYSKKQISKYYIPLLILALFSTLTACTPQSKESYLADYKSFIENVEDKNDKFTEKDWEATDLKYEKFSGEWQEKYEDEFTWKEEIILTKYALQYNIIKAGDNSKEFYNNYVKEDLGELKERLKYYAENDMYEDIEFLVEQAKEVSQTATDEISEALKELNINLKEELEETKNKIKE